MFRLSGPGRLSATHTIDSPISMYARVEWYVPRTGANDPDDDVRRFRCDAARSTELPEMGQSHLLSALRVRGLRECNLWRKSGNARLRAETVLPLQVSDLVAKPFTLARPAILNAAPSPHRYPAKFLSEISMEGDQFWKDVYALCATLLLVRVCCYFCLRWKVISVR